MLNVLPSGVESVMVLQDLKYPKCKVLHHQHQKQVDLVN